MASAAGFLSINIGNWHIFGGSEPIIGDWGSLRDAADCCGGIETCCFGIAEL